MFVGHVSRWLGRSVRRLLLSVSPRESGYGVTYILCWRPLSSNPCADGEFVKVEGLGRSGQARRGEARLRSKMHSGYEGKVILRNEQVAPRVGGVDVIACQATYRTVLLPSASCCVLRRVKVAFSLCSAGEIGGCWMLDDGGSAYGSGSRGGSLSPSSCHAHHVVSDGVFSGSLEAHPKHPPVLTGALAVLLLSASSRIYCSLLSAGWLLAPLALALLRCSGLAGTGASPTRPLPLPLLVRYCHTHSCTPTACRAICPEEEASVSISSCLSVCPCPCLDECRRLYMPAVSLPLLPAL